MSLIFATQLTAVFTAILGVGAIVTAVLAYMAFRKQSREVTAIEQQVSDQKEVTARQTALLQVQSDQLQLQRRQFEREQAERRRVQATGVYFVISLREAPTTSAERADTITPGLLTVRIENTTRQPIYGLVIHWRKGAAPWDQPDAVGTLRPQAFVSRTRSFPDTTLDPSLHGATIRFRDAAGVDWLMEPDGQLTEEPGEGA
jgi:hypothetical protein